jgi:hypothetical protein
MQMNAVLLVVVLALCSLHSCWAKCGTERWSVKTGTDDDASKVDTTPVTTTIKTLVNLNKPSSHPESARVTPTELKTFKIKTTLIEYKHEADQDYHLVIQDGSGNHMIVEIPDPECVEGGKGVFLKGIKNARKQFEAVFTASGSLKKTNTKVTVTGVGFFDFIHGQTGVAPQGIELHPVLDIVISSEENNLTEIRARDRAYINTPDVEEDDEDEDEDEEDGMPAESRPVSASFSAFSGNLTSYEAIQI